MSQLDPLENLLNNLSYHRPDEGTQNDMAMFREVVKGFAQVLDDFCEPGRYKSLAFTALEEVSMRAIGSRAIPPLS